jgi:hypothetical protein
MQTHNLIVLSLATAGTAREDVHNTTRWLHFSFPCIMDSLVQFKGPGRAAAGSEIPLGLGSIQLQFSMARSG